MTTLAGMSGQLCLISHYQQVFMGFYFSFLTTAASHLHLQPRQKAAPRRLFRSRSSCCTHASNAIALARSLKTVTTASEKKKKKLALSLHTRSRSCEHQLLAVCVFFSSRAIHRTPRLSEGVHGPLRTKYGSTNYEGQWAN